MLSIALWHFWFSTETPAAILTVLSNYGFRKCWELSAEVEIGNSAAGKSLPLPEVLCVALVEAPFSPLLSLSLRCIATYPPSRSRGKNDN